MSRGGGPPANRNAGIMAARSRRACLLLFASFFSTITADSSPHHGILIHQRPPALLSVTHVRHRPRPALELLRGGEVGKSPTPPSAQQQQPSLVPLLTSTGLLMVSLSIVSLS